MEEGRALLERRILTGVPVPGTHGGSRRPRFAEPGDTGTMLRTVNWLSRALGFAWVGVLAFVLAPPPETSAVLVQVAGYCLLGLALVAWGVLEVRPVPARYHAEALAVLRGVIAVSSGFASGVGYGGSAMVAFTFVAAMAAGADYDLIGALAVTGAGVLAIEVSGLAFDQGYGVLLGGPTIVISGLIIGRNRGAYRIQAEQAAQLLAQRDALQAEQRRADRLDERARIAREIHDVLAHSLGALGIQIQAARAVLADHGDIERADEILDAAQRMAAEGLVDTRRAVHALRAGTLPPDATIALLRIAQESLVNAAKHAAGQGVSVRLDYSDTDVRLTVRNDLAAGADTSANTGTGTGGQGGARAPGAPAVSTVNGGYGLTGMRERLRLLNGTLQAGRRGNQWVVTAELPRHQPEHALS